MSTLGYDLSGPDDAPALVLGPSLGSSRRMWSASATALSERFRVVSYDLLGHGTSAVPPGPYTIGLMGEAVLDLLDDLELTLVSYAGVSLGGMVGMWLAVNAPERIDRLALICTSAYLPPADGWLDRATQVLGHGTASVADAVVARWFTPGMAPEIVAEYRAMIAGCPADGYAACCDAIAEMDQRATLPRITAPTLVISGTDDAATPPPHGRAIADAVPGARFVVLTEAAHLANVERAADVTALITELLEG